MIGAFYTLIGAILVLGVMILIHEFGHFAAAKLLGVRVEVFSIGFGKRLFGFRRGETDYRISALPLGGYVKMTGVNAVEMPEERSDSDPNDDAEFLQHPRWQRLIIALAGPAMNLVMAVLLLTVVYAYNHEVPWGYDRPAVVGWVVSGSAAEQAGIKSGDHILSVGDQQSPSFQDAIKKIMISPNQPLPVTVQRDGQTLNMTLTPKAEGRSQVGDAGFDVQHPFLITAIEPGLPGDKAGLKVGDEILTADGTRVQSVQAMQVYIQQVKEKPIQLALQRAGRPFTVSVTPKEIVDQGKSLGYRIGFASRPMEVEKLPIGEAFTRSVEDCRKLSGLVFELIGGMVERKVSVKQMSGPIEIVRMSGEVVHHGDMDDLLNFMAMISLQLGLFNLLPIPILDGGLIAMLLIEAAMRRDINEGIKIRLYQAAFVCLVLFAGMVIFNDVVKMLPGQ
ncbi:MAG: RIP metalloprotease RseP [Acidobacteriota bacterium]|nr:RIP metalloprotease RseP [Acidobacteriota bacterium]